MGPQDTGPDLPEPRTYGESQQLHQVGGHGRLTLAEPDW